MSIKYELSLWRDYPGSTGIREEKIEILAATGMDFAGRAQNIKLNREYTGQFTLEFELPLKYFDPLTGIEVKNPLCTKVVEKAKIKLWRDELWWNPFGGEETYNSETECYTYTGQWQQGRWYDLVVNGHKEKRSKKQLMYTFTCNSLFMDELARNGYTLQFVPNSDVMSANGMGTAHDLAARVVEGTNWEYVKTEVFPDYKEEFNGVTGETVKTPVSTDRIDFSKGLDMYCYCYQIDVDDIYENFQGDIETSIQNQLLDLGAITNIEDNIFKDKYYGFDKNTHKFWWRITPEDKIKEYVWAHLKTDISVNSVKNLCSYDAGNMSYYIDNNEDNRKPTGATTFTNGIGAWESVQGSIELSGVTENDNNTGEKFISYMKLISADNKASILYRGAETTPLSQGEIYCIQYSTKDETFPTIKIWDAKSSNYQVAIEEKYSGATAKPVFEYGFNSNNNTNAFNHTLWFIVPSYIGQPHFTLHWDYSSTVLVQSLYIYQCKGYNKEIEEFLSSNRAKQSLTMGLMTDFADSKNYPHYNFTKNLIEKDGEFTPIWLGFGKISVEGYQQENYAYPIEFYNEGKYYDIYLPLTKKGINLTKISSYNADKRRQISGEKSNRFSLLETISSTFQCFTRFMVEHEEDGSIKLNQFGKPIKRFTFVSELGRRNFNGFNYGVNLESVERTVDANNLVTKCHVESISNQYSTSNLVTIQESQYNKLGMTFIYNFSYYLQMGMLDKDKFLKDYNHMVEFVNKRTQENLTAIETNSGKIARQTYLQTRVDTIQLILNSYRTEAQEELDAIAWDRFLDGATVGDKTYKGHRRVGEYDAFGKICTEDDYLFPTIRWGALKNYIRVPEVYWFAYDGDTVINKGLTEAGYKKEGYDPVPSAFQNRQQLATYMARNFLGSADGSWTKVPDNPPIGETFFWARGLSEESVSNTLARIDALQNSYHSQTTEREQAQIELEQINKDVEAYNALLEKNNKEINQKIKWFEERYQQFIIEGEWSGQDYIDADTYYLDATRAQAEACMPKVSYSIGAIDLSQMCNPFNPEETDWGKEFTYDVGDTTYVKDEELFGNTEQLAMIANISSHIDSNKQDSIEIRNYETRFEELFQSVAAAVTSVQLNENIWGRAANFMADGTINEAILQKSIEQNMDLVVASANNSVVQDNRGITITDKDTGKITRLAGGMIFLSGDNGRTFKTGLTPDGINASLITAGRLDTSKIVIRNDETPLFELDSQGLTANRPIDNGFTRFDQFGIYSTDKAGSFGINWWTDLTNSAEEHIINNSAFSVTRLGFNLRFKDGDNTGELTLGRFTDDYKQYYGLCAKDKDGKVTVHIDHNGNAIFSGELKAATGTFNGELKAATGDFTGKITANSGQIGKWEIDSDKLYYPDDGSGIGAGFILSGSTGWNPYFYMGYNKSQNSAGTDYPSGSSIWEPFTKVEISHNGRVRIGQNSDPGQLNFDPINGTLTIKGHINATSGNFGGWQLAQDDSNIFGKIKNSYGIGLDAGAIGTTNIAFAIGSMSSLTGSWSSAKFRVDGQGKVFCQNLKITGGEIDIGNGSFTVDNKGVMSCTGANISGESVLSSGVKLTESASIWYDDNSAIKGTYLQFGHGASRDSYDSSLFVGTLTYNDHTQSCLTRLVAHRNSYNKVYIKLESGYHEAEGYLGGTWRGSSSVSVCSDRRIKHEISSLSEKYSLFFDKLCPVTYKYNNGTSDRLHTGFIAQDIQNALTLAELTTNEFAGFVISHPSTEQETYALRYEEFIALNTSEIQKLKKRVAELERKLESLTKTNTSGII